MGIVEIRHGSGVYVTRSDDVLLLASDYSGTVTKKLLLDLIHTRIPLEMHSVSEAIKNATLEDSVELRRTLITAGQNLANDDVLNEVSERDHQEHLGILEALELRNEKLAVERMRKHLEGVAGSIERWSAEDHPVAGR